MILSRGKKRPVTGSPWWRGFLQAQVPPLAMRPPRSWPCLSVSPDFHLPITPAADPRREAEIMQGKSGIGLKESQACPSCKHQPRMPSNRSQGHRQHTTQDRPLCTRFGARNRRLEARGLAASPRRLTELYYMRRASITLHGVRVVMVVSLNSAPVE